MTTKDAPDWQTVVLPIVVVSTAPSPVVIAPDLLTSVQRAYLAGSTGTVDLVAAPQPSPITVVQQAVGTSTDGSTVQITLPTTPTVGNLLVLMVASGDGGSLAGANQLAARWAGTGSAGAVMGFTSSVKSTDTATFDLTFYSPASYNFSAMLYEVSGADLTTPVTDTNLVYSSSGQTVTASLLTTNTNEYGFMATAFLGSPAVAQPGAYSATSAGSAAPATYDGTTQFVGYGSFVAQAVFGNGPLSVPQGGTGVTATQSIGGSVGVTDNIEGLLMMINPGSSPVSQAQIRVWALDILGSSTDQPYIERNDSLQTLLSTTGPISRWVSFEPGGLLLPAGTGLTATAVDSADFGAVWQPA